MRTRPSCRATGCLRGPTEEGGQRGRLEAYRDRIRVIGCSTGSDQSKTSWEKYREEGRMRRGGHVAQFSQVKSHVGHDTCIIHVYAYNKV